MAPYQLRIEFIEAFVQIRVTGRAAPGEAEALVLMIQGVAERLSARGVLINLQDLLWYPSNRDLERLLRVLPRDAKHSGRVADLHHHRNSVFLHRYQQRAKSLGMEIALFTSSKRAWEWLRALPPL